MKKLLGIFLIFIGAAPLPVITVVEYGALAFWAVLAYSLIVTIMFFVGVALIVDE